MKADINERGNLVLRSETEEDADKIHRWIKKYNFMYISPEKDELAKRQFKFDVEVALHIGPSQIQYK